MDECTVPIFARSRRTSRAASTIVLLLALLGGSLSTGVVAAHADDTDGISGTPSDGQGQDDRSRFSYQASPGQHLEDSYLVRNTGTTLQTMQVFATDAYNTEDGSYGLLDTDAAVTDAGNWVTFAGGQKKMSIPLDPGASQVVPFTVDVPADARPGDHAAGIVISVQSAEGQVLVDRRVATRVYVRVPGDLQPALTISSLEARYNPSINPFDGSTTLTFTLKNAGNVALGANLVMGVNGLFGMTLGEVKRQELTEMLPGSTRTVTVDVKGVGQYAYLNPYVKLAAVIDADALNPGPLPATSRDTVTIAWPIWLLVLAAIALLVWLWLRWRRRSDAKNAAAWIAYTEEEARRKAEAERGTVPAAGVTPASPPATAPAASQAASPAASQAASTTAGPPASPLHPEGRR